MEIRSYVALGDSFTEGLDDLTAADGGYRGWADRFAEHLADLQPGLRYANLAVRGKVLQEVADEQLPQAIAMRPDLVSIAAGGNDMLRPGADPDLLAESFDAVILELQQAGLPVLMFTGFDPRFPVLRLSAARWPRSTCTCGPSPTGTTATWWTCGPCRCCAIPGPGVPTGCTSPPTATTG